VFTFRDDGRVKSRRLYLSLHSAIRAKDRTEAKGERFELMLVELVPVPHSPVIVVGGGDRWCSYDCSTSCPTCTPESRSWRDEYPGQAYRHSDPPVQVSNLDSQSAAQGWSA